MTPFPRFSDDRYPPNWLEMSEEEFLDAYHAQPWWTYQQFDADGRLLYVGETVNPLKRENLHRHASPWWPQVARTEYEEHPSYHAALDHERRLIVELRPLYNVMGNPDRAEAIARRAALKSQAVAS